ncbi:MAG: hypothetical protein HYY17_09825 [Planctomycetes bacterium]|nr:hypothetical protein [Planctomycetota bacterium]
MTPYVASAVEREIALVRSAPHGARNAALHRAAYALGGLPLDVQEVESALVGAAIEAGLPEREARAVVRRSLRRGAEHPREIPTTAAHGPVRAPAARPAIPPPSYPPHDELLDMVRNSLPVTSDPEAVAWLASRGLDPEAVEVWHLARALAPEGPLPSWARCGSRDWRESGHRLLLPLFDARGSLRSVKARAVCAEAERKELAPTGYSTGGLIFACIMGRRLLAGDVPEWWTPQILVVEGAPDWLTWGARQSDAREDGPAVLGVGAGSWTPAIATRIPDGSTVYLRGHSDAAGARYLDAIEATLAGRCRIFRRRA